MKMYESLFLKKDKEDERKKKLKEKRDLRKNLLSDAKGIPASMKDDQSNLEQKITEEKAVRRRNRWSHRHKRRGRPAFRHRSISEDQAINPSTSELEESRENEMSEK